MPLKTWLARDLPKLKVSAQIKYDSPVYCDYFSSAELSVIPSHSLWLLESCPPRFLCLPALGQSWDKTRKVSFSSLVMPLLLVIPLSALLSPPDNKSDFYLSSPGVSWNAKTLDQKGWGIGEKDFSSLPFGSRREIQTAPGCKRKPLLGWFIYLFMQRQGCTL